MFLLSWPNWLLTLLIFTFSSHPASCVVTGVVLFLRSMSLALLSSSSSVPSSFPCPSFPSGSQKLSSGPKSSLPLSSSRLKFSSSASFETVVGSIVVEIGVVVVLGCICVVFALAIFGFVVVMAKIVLGVVIVGERVVGVLFVESLL